MNSDQLHSPSTILLSNNSISEFMVKFSRCFLLVEKILKSFMQAQSKDLQSALTENTINSPSDYKTMEQHAKIHSCLCVRTHNFSTLLPSRG